MPTPYMVGRFNSLADRGRLDFEVWFNLQHEPDRSWFIQEDDWRFKARFVEPTRVFGKDLYLPIDELTTVQPDLIVMMQAVGWTNPASPSKGYTTSIAGSLSFALGATVARSHKSRLTFRVLPLFQTWSHRSAIKEAVKKALFSIADGVKVPGAAGANYSRSYGVPRDRIMTVCQSIDVEHFSSAMNVAEDWRDTKRRELGLWGCCFVYCGRLWKGKGLEYLIDAFAEIQRSGSDVSLLILGEGVDGPQYKAMTQSLSSVTYLGFVQPEEVPTYLALGDVFVFPTLGDPHGLVVTEAMAAGLPVISTTAAGDMDKRVIEGETGFLVEPANSAQLAEKMRLLTENDQLRKSIAQKGFVSVKESTHENWAKEFETFVDKILQIPPRRSWVTFSSSLCGHVLRRLLRQTESRRVASANDISGSDSEVD